MMDNITSAESLSDILHQSNKLNLNDNTIQAICKARYETMCKNSPIGLHKCAVKIHFNPFWELAPISCDTCLQRELEQLNKNEGVETIGSCCGHGLLDGYIQVAEHSVKKMLLLGYKKIEPDEYGNGINCFKPKTILYKERENDGKTCSN